MKNKIEKNRSYMKQMIMEDAAGFSHKDELLKVVDAMPDYKFECEEFETYADSILEAHLINTDWQLWKQVYRTFA